MRLEFNEEHLLKLMKDFYILTNIRIVLFDDEFREVLSYPYTDCPFCKMMKQHPAAGALCKESDTHSFRQSRADKQLLIYHCHAGLIEATIPLVDNHAVIGYLMFGQISDAESLPDLEQMLLGVLKKQQLPAVKDCCRDIPLKTNEEIEAAAKIMEACTFYVLYDEAIALRRQNFVNNLQNYLRSHLQENLTAEAIADSLNISRSKLYLACDKNLGMGIAEYVRLLRIDEARRLLKETDYSITRIANMTGFADYNYFCRVFKKMTGVSAKKYRS
ncbi:PocR ligand-binding domain-containing protein [Murimonas intestini]|uniref:PocR ligand-binding domain-containing protein n=1 Tax=Murimonas intestini TaxID=1337051 RepID=UPI0011DC91C8|nr:PocR ligand-binding domain-containing protein [Murimonas intestini]